MNVLTEFNMVVGGAYFHISREFVNAHCPCENLCKKRKLAEKEAGCLLNINIGQIFMEAHPAARVKLQIKPREKLVCFQRYELKLCSIQSSFNIRKKNFQCGENAGDLASFSFHFPSLKFKLHINCSLPQLSSLSSIIKALAEREIYYECAWN